MTQWAVRNSLSTVLVSGCDAMGGEKQFKVGFGGGMVLASGCDALGCERQFKEGFGGRM